LGLPKFILSDFFVQYLIRGIALGTPLHEYCHLVTLRLLGRYELIGAGSLIGGTLMVGAIAAYILTRLQQVVPT